MMMRGTCYQEGLFPLHLSGLNSQKEHLQDGIPGGSHVPRHLHPLPVEQKTWVHIKAHKKGTTVAA